MPVRFLIVLSSLLTVACATAPPHPPTGVMWGYFATPQNPPNLQVIGYAADRPSCEDSRAAAQRRSGLPAASERLSQCQEVTVLPYREGADSVYWAFSAGSGREQFTTGVTDRAFCANLRNESLKASGPKTSVSECEAVIVKRVR